MTAKYKGPYIIEKVHSNEKTYVIALKLDPSHDVRAEHCDLRPCIDATALLQKSHMFSPRTADEGGPDVSWKINSGFRAEENFEISPGIDLFLLASARLPGPGRSPPILPAVNTLLC